MILVPTPVNIRVLKIHVPVIRGYSFPTNTTGFDCHFRLASHQLVQRVSLKPKNGFLIVHGSTTLHVSRSSCLWCWVRGMGICTKIILPYSIMLHWWVLTCFSLLELLPIDLFHIVNVPTTPKSLISPSNVFLKIKLRQNTHSKIDNISERLWSTTILLSNLRSKQLK